MCNLLNNELKVKLDSFKNFTQMELFSNIDESIGTLSGEQISFINCYAVIGKNVPGLSAQPSLTGRPMSCRERILKLFFLKSFLNIPTTKAARRLVNLDSHKRITRNLLLSFILTSKRRKISFVFCDFIVMRSFGHITMKSLK